MLAPRIFQSRDVKQYSDNVFSFRRFHSIRNIKQILTFYQFGNCKGVLLKYRSFIFHALNQSKAFKIIFWLKGVKTPQNYKRFTGVHVSRNPESFEGKIYKH